MMKILYSKSMFIFFILIFSYFIVSGQNSEPYEYEYFAGGKICYEDEPWYDPDAWQLIFEDEFEGDEIDHDKWYTYAPLGSDENDDQCKNCRTHFWDDDNAVMRDENVQVCNGVLKLKVKRKDNVFNEKQFYYTQAQIFSKEEFSSYIKVEIRCKMPANLWTYKVFWTNGWGAEIDMFETWEPSKFLMSAGENYKWFNHALVYPDNIEGINGIDPNDWHVYSFEYEPYFIKYYIDDVLVSSIPRYKESQSGIDWTVDQSEPGLWTNIYDKPDIDYECDLDPGYYQKNMGYPPDNRPMHLIAGNSPMKSLTKDDFPENTLMETFKIDYIRVYQKCSRGGETLSLDIGETKTITGNHNYKSIFLKEGSTLNIQDADLAFSTFGGITGYKANINIENSKLHSQCGQWNGIVAFDGTDVNIDQSTISQATTGLFVYKNAKFNMTDSDINHCDFGIKIYDNNENKNIDNWSGFGDNKVGVFVLNSDNLNISHTFFYSNDLALRSVDSYVNISNDVKVDVGDRGSDGIFIEGTYPTSSGGNIGDPDNHYNYFTGAVSNGDDKSILLQCAGNTHPASTIVTNNIFDGRNGENGIIIYGENDFTINNNQINWNQFGINVDASGDLDNVVKCNEFWSNSLVDNTYENNNENTQFLQNKTYGYPLINYLIKGAQMNDKIGTRPNPAGNIFSHGNSADILTVPSSLYASAFNYYYHFEDTEDELEVPLTPGVYKAKLVKETAHHCENNHIGRFDKIDPDGDNDDYGGDTLDNDNLGVDTIIIACCLFDILDSINHNIDIVVHLGGDDPRTPQNEGYDEKSDDVVLAEERMNQWINYGVYAGIKTQNYDFADKVLRPLTLLKWKKIHYGMKIREGDLKTAKQILDNIPVRTQDVKYFKDVQYINLKRFKALKSGDWTIDDNDLQQLATIANSPYPAKGYAWSLYRLLTGKEIAFRNPDISEVLDYRDEKKPKANNFNDLIYPNPTWDLINIISGGKSKIKTVNIYNIQGKLVYNKEYDSNEVKINVSQFLSGVYMISVYKDDGSKFSKKVFIK